MRVFRAPGRVNLIGEHTDYSLGFVLPVALDLACFTAVAPSTDGRVHLYSQNRNDTREWQAGEIASLKPTKLWTDYVIGVAQMLAGAGYPIAPSNIYIYSTVPEGGGLSSSAALEVSSALAFLAGRDIRPLELAKLCQRAEREFVGMPCGIMDQYISVFGQAHAAVKIDCRSLSSEVVNLPRVEIIAVNTMVKHELGQSAYRQRVQECAEAVQTLHQKYGEISSLRDATLEQLKSVRSLLPPVVFRRARHVITENARVGLFQSAAQSQELEEMGRLFLASHRSLHYDYEVSCPELDFLVETATGMSGVYGARMTGGGFGGCTVNLVAPDIAETFRSDMRDAYSWMFGIEPRIYDCQPSPGAGEWT